MANLIIKPTKSYTINIPRTSKCVRCGDSSKINQSSVDNENDILIAEYICDCGHIDKKIIKISYI